MGNYDRTVDIDAAPSSVSDAIKASVSPNEQLIISRPDTLLIALRQNMGYVYLLRPQDDNKTRLRLLVDTAQAVREAFRGKTPKEALMILAAPGAGSQAVMSAADEHLASLKQASEKPLRRSSAPFTFTPIVDNPTTNVPSEPLAPLPSDPNNIGSLFDKKPLPVDGASSRLPSGTPWNPDRLVGWAVFFAPASGIAMALNWPRLGKPRWLLPTLLAAIGIPIGAIVLAIGMIALIPKSSASAFPIILLLLSLNWAFIWGLYWLQRGAYKTWDRTGSATELLSYQYNFTNAGIAGAVVMLVFLLVGIGVIYTRNQPNTFDSADLSVTYPGVWRSVDVNKVSNCKQNGFHCIIIVTQGSISYTTIFLGYYDNPASISTSEAESGAATSLLADKPGSTIISHDKTTVSGIAAYRHYFTVPISKNCECDDYGMQLFFRKGSRMYVMTVESASQDTFQGDLTESQQFIAGIKLK